MEPADVTFDRVTGAMYFYRTHKPVARTVPVADLVMVDLDADGDVVGVELAMDCWHFDDWLQRVIADDDERETLEVLNDPVAMASLAEARAADPSTHISMDEAGALLAERKAREAGAAD